MKKYSVHFIYAIILLGLLGFITTESIKTVLDPTYQISSARYIPKALIWYLCAFLWWGVLSIAYRIEIGEDNTLNSYSILKQEVIFPEDIISIEDNLLSYTVIHSKGKTRISNLIDGLSSVKLTLTKMRFKAMGCGTKPSANTNNENMDFRKMLLQILFVLILIGFALFIELDHISNIIKWN